MRRDLTTRSIILEMRDSVSRRLPQVGFLILHYVKPYNEMRVSLKIRVFFF